MGTGNPLAVLSVDLQANTAAFQGDMGKAARIAEKELKNISDAAGAAGKLVGGALIAGASSFAFMAKQAIDAADEMNDTSQKVGMTTEQLSAYSYAAKMSGSDTETMTTAVQKLNSNMADAARGQGSAKAALDALGISVKDANGNLKTNDQVMREVADRFAQFPDGATKSAMAVDIFGKSGADLIPMLDEGSAGLDKMKAEAAAMGLILSTETAKAAGEVNDNLDKMSMIISGQVSKATADMLPVIQQLTGDLLANAQESGALETAMRGLTGAFKIVVSAGYLTAGVFDYVGTAMGELAGAAVAFASGDFEGAKRFFTEGTTAGDAFAGKLDSIRKIWDENTVAANAAAAANDKALGKTPAYGAKGGKKPAAKAGKDSFDYSASGSLFGGMDERAEAEAESARAFIAKERQKAEADVEAIKQSLLTKRQVIDQDFQLRQQQIQSASEYITMTEQQKNDLLFGIAQQHKAKIAELDAQELASKRAAAAASVGFATGALSAIGNHSSKAAKAAAILNKVTAIQKISADTPAAAMAAAKWASGFLGPIGGAAAAAIMYGLGGAAIAAVSSGGMPSSSGGGGSMSLPSGTEAANNVMPLSAQQQNQPTQTTIVKIESDQIFIGRQLIDLLNEVQGDGKTLNAVRYVPA